MNPGIDDNGELWDGSYLSRNPIPLDVTHSLVDEAASRSDASEMLPERIPKGVGDHGPLHIAGPDRWVDVEFTLRPSELSAANRALAIRHWSFPIELLMGAFLILAPIGHLSTSNVIAAVIVPAFLCWQLFLRGHWIWMRHARWKEPQRVVVSSQGIRNGTATVQSEYSWKAVRGFCRASHMFLFMVSRRSAIVLPDRALTYEPLKLRLQLGAAGVRHL